MSVDQSQGTVSLRISLNGWSLGAKNMAYETMTCWGMGFTISLVILNLNQFTSFWHSMVLKDPIVA